MNKRMRRAGKATLWPAPAKLNLFLHVTGRRSDGYHDLQTLFQLLDWGDEVRIEVLNEPEICRPSAAYPVAESDDLAVRAALLLQAETSCRKGARIEVIKRIPAGAGLGGGSSDAATVMLVLNRLWGCDLCEDALASIGLRLGADLPVFIRGRSALGTGVGDRLDPVELGERHYLLVVPEFSISTQAVFMDPDLPRNSPRLDLPQALSGDGRNDCEWVVKKRFPAFAGLLQELRKLGDARMTGTGSAIFIDMPDEKTAMSTAEEIKCRYNVRAVRGVDRSPLHELLDSCDIRSQ
jgi:4-diphosphocytidyl-2-C-methyl-D-erythritol kinase